MSTPGKYVRAPSISSDDDTDELASAEGISGLYVRACPGPIIEERQSEESRNLDAPDNQLELANKLKELESVIQVLRNRNDSHPGNSSTVLASAPRGSSDITATEGNIRWDSITPFPKNVPASKMWEAWMCFIEDFELASSLSNVKNPKRRVELLLLSMGEELKGVVRAAKLRPDPDSDNCYEIFKNNIDRYLKSMTDPAAEHESFLNMRQEDGESAVNFHARLSRKVQLCGYSPDDQDRFVRTQLLRGLRNQELKKAARMYGHDSNFIVQSATRAEGFQAEVTPSATESSTFIVSAGQYRGSQDRFKRKAEQQEKRFGNSSKRFRPNRTVADGGRAHPRVEMTRRNRCPRCFRSSHMGSECPAKWRNCNSCGAVGHFAVACRGHRVNVVKDEEVSTRAAIEDSKDQQINALSLQDVLIDCRVGSSNPIKFLIDSGADVNVLGGADWDNLEQQLRACKVELIPLERTINRNLQAYASNKPMEVEHAFTATVEAVGGTKPPVTADFLVVRAGKRSLLGRVTASDMGLLKVGETINTCESGIFPKMPGVKVKFSVDDSIPPVRNAYYNIPAAYREGARRRLEEMEARGIIERVTQAPQWISGMSAVPKGKEDFRLVVNMRPPNKAIKREHFRMPSIDEMRIKLHGAKYFSKLDLSNAFYHIELNEESRELTTFLSENGMFRFTRLMFGVNCAPEIFQREMTRILKDVKNKIVFIDDILLFAGTIEELRKTVSQVLQILRSNNLSLNTDKCEFDRTNIRFLGHELNEKGFNIEESKVGDVRKFRRPTTASELRSFLGLASFVSPYINNFADISSPLWMVASSQKWSWGEDQEKAFELIKNRIIHSTVTLGYFSECDRTYLYTDASPRALGAVLVQQNEDGIYRIISFASKSLTTTERKYAQNQREALSAVWAVEHFSYFLLGRHFDSKRALTRADGWALRLSPYDYDIEYIRGHENIADPSSRLYDGEDGAFNEEVSPWEICSLNSQSVDFLTEEEIRESTKNDDTLLLVISSLDTGKWSKDLARFKAVAEDLRYTDGIVSKNGCAVIPEGLQKKALEIAHAGHPLEAKFKSILRSRVWWPGMSGDAEKWVKACATCAVNGRPERPPPMQRSFAPKAAWETIALDFNGPYLKFGNITILVIIDLRSRYAIARPVKSTKFEYTKEVLDSVFEKEGFPRAIKSDNGPPFNGEDYARYCSERGIQVIFSTPFYPQQNGLVEGFMKIVNKAMCTAVSTGANYQRELQSAVQAYNAADHSITKVSPEEALSGRKIKRGLPLLHYGKSNHNEVELDVRDREAKLLSKSREDARRGARACKVKPGDTVIVERQTRSKGESRFGSKRYVVSDERNGSLVLCDSEGQKLKRHVSQTKKVQEWRQQQSTGEQDHNPELPPDGGREQRPAREKRTPSYLSDYIRELEQNPKS
ncbi:uncharacterized protein K02A2.6-like isoform X2 [Aedes albopictus]|uniref:RNA-directed DNA polymerase n=1 Tax=Aedes albopictus TaxID=7160 RepID=A0ABM1ZLB8_AEDAL